MADPELRLVFRELGREGFLDDAFFDRIYPEWAASLSRIHWTPIPVIRRATELLVAGRPEARVLDVGSGAGKFCLAGSILCSARFTGIEHRPRLHELSRRLVAHYRIPRVRFVLGELCELDWRDFDAVYLYNPFQEYKTPHQRIDSEIELRRGDFDRYVSAVQERLRQMPAGARVVTYHGFGGAMPRGYRRLAGEFCFRGPLECWEKRDGEEPRGWVRRLRTFGREE